MAQISITLASALSVAFTLTGVGSSVTIGSPAPVVVTELMGAGSTVTIGSPAPVVVTELSGVGSTITIDPPAPVVVTELSEFMRGPPGPAAASYPGKTMVWNQGVLSEVRLYDDAEQTQLAERRVLTYTGDVLTSIAFYSGDGTLTKTRTLGYSSGVLTSVTEA